MRNAFLPIELMILCVAGMMTERERLIRLYQQEEIRVLRELLGKQPRLNDNQRRRLAVLGKQLGRKLLGEWSTLVTVLSRNQATRKHRE